MSDQTWEMTEEPVFPKLRLQKGDVLLISSPGAVSPDAANRIESKIKEYFGDDVKVLVLGDGMSCQVLSGR